MGRKERNDELKQVYSFNSQIFLFSRQAIINIFSAVLLCQLFMVLGITESTPLGGVLGQAMLGLGISLNSLVVNALQGKSISSDYR